MTLKKLNLLRIEQSCRQTSKVVLCDAPTPVHTWQKARKLIQTIPLLKEAVLGEHADEYRKAMVTEINQLLRQRTWDHVDKASIPKGPDGKPRRVLPGAWAFKLMCLPDGTPLKFKARYCVRGDLQKEGIGYFYMYAPVVQWSTVCMVLSLSYSLQWMDHQTSRLYKPGRDTKRFLRSNRQGNESAAAVETFVWT